MSQDITNFLDMPSHKNTVKVSDNPSYQLRSCDSIKVSDNQAYISHARNDNMTYDYVETPLNARELADHITDKIGDKSDNIYY